MDGRNYVGNEAKGELSGIMGGGIKGVGIVWN